MDSASATMGSAGASVVEEGTLASTRFLAGFLVFALIWVFVFAPSVDLERSSGAGASFAKTIY